MGLESDYEPRNLTYPLTYPLASSAQLDDAEAIADSQFTWPTTDNDERVAVVIELSLNEYIGIATCVDVGRDIAFAEDSLKLWWIWNRIISTMTLCDQIAECVSSNQAVIDAITSAMLAQGFGQNYGTGTPPKPQITAEQSSGNLLPSGTDCENYPKLMGMSRGIVRALNSSTVDLLEIIEYVTNDTELTAIVSENIPVIGGAIGSAAAFANWLQETFSEAYAAAYTDAVEDTLACAIFCYMVDNCTITLDALIDIYVSEGGISEPDDINDIFSIIDWAINLTLDLSIFTVAAFHYLILLFLRFGGGLADFVGIGSLSEIIKSSYGFTDYSYDDCDCTPVPDPTDYWMIYQDFSVGLGAFVLTQGEQVSGGIQSITVSGNSQIQVRIPDFGGTFVIRAGGQINQRRGSNGNGSNDTARMSAWSGADVTGTEYITQNQAFITCETNDCNWQAEGTPSPVAQSFRILDKLTGATNVPNDFIVLRSAVIYGEADGLGQKPDMAVWVDTLPAPPDLFPV